MLLFLYRGNSQGYYPLEIGNVWEYWDTTWDEYLYTIQTIGDTVMQNGEEYTVLESEWASGSGTIGYIRQSGSQVYYYITEFEQNEILVFDFSKTTGDTVAIHYYPGDTTVVTVVYDQMANIFGKIRRQWGFWEQSLTSTAYILTEVTDSIGVTWISWEAGPYDIDLRGAIIDGITYGTITMEETYHNTYPKDYQLFQNYPNPFNSSTIITFQVPHEDYATVIIFDIMGRQVRKLFRGEVRVGLKKIVWDSKDDSGIELGSGPYIYRIQTGNFINSMKMTLVR